MNLSATTSNIPNRQEPVYLDSQDFRQSTIDEHCRILDLADSTQYVAVLDSYALYLDELESLDQSRKCFREWATRWTAYHAPLARSVEWQLRMSPAASNTQLYFELKRLAADRYFDRLATALPDHKPVIERIRESSFRDWILARATPTMHICNVAALAEQLKPTSTLEGLPAELLQRYQNELDVEIGRLLAMRERLGGDIARAKEDKNQIALAKTIAAPLLVEARIRSMTEDVIRALATILDESIRNEFLRRATDSMYPSFTSSPIVDQIHQELAKADVPSSTRTALQNLLDSFNAAVSERTDDLRRAYDAQFDPAQIEDWADRSAKATLAIPVELSEPVDQTFQQEQRGLRQLASDYGIRLRALLAEDGVRPPDAGRNAKSGVSVEVSLCITKDDVRSVFKQLSIDEDRILVAEVIYDDIETEYKAMAIEAAARRSGIETETRNANELSPRFPPKLAADFRAWRDTRLQLDQRLLSDLTSLMLTEKERGVLTEALTAAVIKRTLPIIASRMKGLRIVHLSDLLPEGRVNDDNRRLTKVCANYASDLRAACDAFRLERDWRLAEASWIHDHADLSVKEDAVHVVESLQRYFALGREIERINDVYRLMIAECLQPADGQDFLNHIIRVEFTDVFRRSPADLVFDSLLESGKISSAQRSALTALRKEYDESEGGLRQSIINALKTWNSPSLLKDRSIRLTMAAGGTASEEDLETEHPAIPLWEAENRLVRDCCSDIKALFSDEQLQELPLNVQYVLRTW